MSYNNKKIFLYITLCIFIADAFFVLINYYNDRENLQYDLEHQSKQFQTSFEVALSMTTANMSQLATYVANDPSIQATFKKTADAFKASGNNIKDIPTQRYRDELYQKVENSWKEMKNRFLVRQLHFHVAPDISLLRVHRQNKWGDDLSPLRHMIVDTMQDKTPRQGFELGRIYAGLRGSVPVYAPSKTEQKGDFIGVLEAGTSFSEIIDVLESQIGASIAVLLNGERVSEVKWKNGMGGNHVEVCGCFVEAQSDEKLFDIIGDIDLSASRENEPFKLRTSVVDISGQRYMLTSFGIRDYIGIRDNSEVPVGNVVMWSTVEHKFSSLYDNTLTNIIYAVFGFFVIEILIFIGINAVRNQLNNEIERQAGEIKVLLEKSLQANKAKNEFLANMSHELRTPMMGIKGGLDLLKGNSSLDAEANQSLKHLDSSSNALMSLVDDILDLSKIEAGKLKLELAPNNPSLICSEVHETFKAVARKKGLDFKFISPQEFDEWFIFDGMRFRQVLSNLVNNAIKFTDKGAVTLELVKQNTCLVVSVSDTGIGMTPQQAEEIFERFTQADGSTNRKYGGTGLGLTISKELAGLLNGDISVESELGEGSVFKLSIDAEPCQKPEYSEQNSVRLEALKILLAEDNPVNQKVISGILQKNNHLVDVADDGVQALELAEKNQYEVILMDVQMPNMDGREATQKIRNGDGPNKDGIIIAFTADAISEHIKDFLENGFNSVVVKPVKYEILEDKIIEAWNSKK
ncbi:hybrid sensor histidine kinase/response regulator [Terasakiella pusilla]|uniref:hybrid sensor histidine kinase/response regulator n=1 Tax=Terasakiella pusilla TaxID=64973 RepID=UPI0006921B11|nr:ATP-binding protein [Terasakiella pusilla]